MSDFIDDAELRRRAERRLHRRGEFYLHFGIYAVVNLVLWGIWLFTGMGFPWPMILTLLWGAGLAGHGADVYFDTNSRAVAVERSVRQHMREIYGDDWSDTANQDEYNRVRTTIMRAFNKRKEFLIHLSVFLPVILTFWMVWLLTQEWVPFPWPGLLTLGWGIGLFVHGLDTYFQSSRYSLSREQAVQREIEREREQLRDEGKRKAKRKRDRLALSEDGELLEIVDDEWEANNEHSKPG